MMMRSLRTVAWLTAVWIALWEDLSWANLLGGVAVGTFVILLVPLQSRDFDLGFRPVAFLKLAAYFIWELAEASAIIAWEVVTPRNRINQGIVAVPMVGASDGLVTLAANMVSLTPGTLTLEVRRDPPTLYVHVLHLRSVEEVRLDVREFEQRAIAAFGPAPEGRGS